MDRPVLNDEAPADWPPMGALCSAVAERVVRLLAECEDGQATLIRLIMSSKRRVLSADPRPHSSIVVTATCVSAGGAWQSALWPAVAMECAMAAADVFDDIADGEAQSLNEQFGSGAVVMGAAGLLALAAGVVLRAVDDGVPQSTVLDLGRLFSEYLVRAAAGQARSLSARAKGITAGAHVRTQCATPVGRRVVENCRGSRLQGQSGGAVRVTTTRAPHLAWSAVPVLVLMDLYRYSIELATSRPSVAPILGASLLQLQASGGAHRPHPLARSKATSTGSLIKRQIYGT